MLGASAPLSSHYTLYLSPDPHWDTLHLYVTAALPFPSHSPSSWGSVKSTVPRSHVCSSHRPGARVGRPRPGRPCSQRFAPGARRLLVLAAGAPGAAGSDRQGLVKRGARTGSADTSGEDRGTEDRVRGRPGVTRTLKAWRWGSGSYLLGYRQSVRRASPVPQWFRWAWERSHGGGQSGLDWFSPCASVCVCLLRLLAVYWGWLGAVSEGSSRCRGGVRAPARSASIDFQARLEPIWRPVGGQSSVVTLRGWTRLIRPAADQYRPNWASPGPLPSGGTGPRTFWHRKLLRKSFSEEKLVFNGLEVGFKCPDWPEAVCDVSVWRVGTSR